MKRPIKNVFNMRRLVDKLKSRKESKVEEILVIGIDFGTTFSGAAWATIEDFESEQINMILSWPGHGREEGKAPTSIYYDDTGEVKWGYDIPDEVTPLQWFKLLLLRREDLPEEVQQSNALLEAKRLLKQSGKSEVDVIADYLRVLWEHIIDTIRKDRDEWVVDAMELHVVITVPAIWQGYARQAMKEAAKKAGIMNHRSAGPTTLSFAPEPEAAAMATMCENERSLNIDDTYILCDAGGGTVDLVNYQITDTEPLELREVGIGTGGLCGGIFIDEYFRTMCKDRLGRLWNKLSSKGVREIMTKEWEVGIKPQFKPQNTKKEYIVSIPAEAVGKSALNNPSKGIKNGRIHFSSHDIEQAFTKVFSRIKGLIDDQIQKATQAHLSVKGIILVGGLGSSAYLREYLSSKYKPQQIEILQSSGRKPRTAICRGAIFKGFIDGPNSNDEKGFTVIRPVQVVSSVARQSMGLVMRRDFLEGIHEEKDRVWRADEGRYCATNQMEWLIKKGDHVQNSQPVTYRCSEIWGPSAKDNLTLSIQFCQCQADRPPQRKTDLVQALCRIDCRIDVPYQSLEDYHAPNGNILKKAAFDIKVVPSGATVEFSVFHSGKLLGSRDVEVEFD
ncbi:hypothetical protein E8E14_006718 [Neopestalotiopsis sp. 37M]|nr:hypothetical protein E8E14_006718 [Neopestalotiopsis sp. 37M]